MSHSSVTSADFDIPWHRIGIGVILIALVAFKGITLWPKSIWNADVDGCIVPLLLATFLLFMSKQPIRTLLAVAVTAIGSTMLSTVMTNRVEIPMFGLVIIIGAICTIITTKNVGIMAFIAGTLGTWIGADLININAPGIMGGAGIEDGVFLTGLYAALFAEMLARWVDYGRD